MPSLLNSANQYHYVGFWPRVVAKLIDISILALVTYLLHLIDTAYPFGSMASSIDKVSRYASLAILYYTVSFWKFSGTVGNHLIHQRVLRNNGHALSFGQAVFRASIIVLSE